MSQYAKAVPNILADMEKDREENDQAQQQPDQRDDIPELVIHRYHVEGGGVILSSVELEENQPPIIESKPSEPPHQPTRKEPPFFVVVLIIFFLFLLLDSVDTTLTALFTPTVTVTLIPKSQIITLRASLPLGKLLAPITVSQSLTVPASGQRHQKAAYAKGYVTFYNGLSTEQTIPAGTVLTGSDEVQIVTTETANIPPNAPPEDGYITVMARAVNTGTSGNIPPYDVSIALSSSLTAKNLTAFSGGLDERYYQVVTQDDIANASAILKVKVVAGMTAALQSQVMPGEKIQPTPCNPSVTADQAPGDEAPTVSVRVSEQCTAIAYNENILQVKATQLLTTQAVKIIGNGYAMYGNLNITITKATTTNTTVVLSFTTQATYIYEVSDQAKARIVQLIAGKPRATALHQLVTLAGIQHVSISGIPDNQPLPDDTQHIHIVIISFLSS